MSLGLIPSRFEYFEFVQDYEETHTINEENEYLFSGVKDHFVDFYISLDEDAVQTVRNVYTIWDVFGDIGGLIDMFKILA